MSEAASVVDGRYHITITTERVRVLVLVLILSLVLVVVVVVLLLPLLLLVLLNRVLLRTTTITSTGWSAAIAWKQWVGGASLEPLALPRAACCHGPQREGQDRGRHPCYDRM
jgi:hypothetical protein